MAEFQVKEIFSTAPGTDFSSFPTIHEFRPSSKPAGFPVPAGAYGWGIPPPTICPGYVIEARPTHKMHPCLIESFVRTNK